MKKRQTKLNKYQVFVYNPITLKLMVAYPSVATASKHDLKNYGSYDKILSELNSGDIKYGGWLYSKTFYKPRSFFSRIWYLIFNNEK